MHGFLCEVVITVVEGSTDIPYYSLIRQLSIWSIIGRPQQVPR